MEFIDFKELQNSPSTWKNDSLLVLQDPDVIIAHKVFVGFALVYSPLITVCNLLVFCGTLIYPGSQMNNQSYLLLSLSAADFLMGSFSIPMYILSYLPHTKYVIFKNKYLCLMWFASAELAAASSIGSLLCISIDRYIAVVCPLQYQTMVTEQRTIAVLMLLWLIVTFVSFLPIFGWNTYDPNLYPLSVRCSFYATLPHSYIVWVSFGSVAFIVFVCSVMYAHILTISYKQVKLSEQRTLRLAPSTSRQFRMRVYSVKITSVLVLLFIVLWLPVVFAAPLKYYNVFSPKAFEILQIVSQLLYFSNSLVNAPIYSMLRSEYRDVYRVMLLTVPWKWRGVLRELYRASHASVYCQPERRHTSSPVDIAMSSHEVPVEQLRSIAEEAASMIEEFKRKTSLMSKADESKPRTSMLVRTDEGKPRGSMLPRKSVTIALINVEN